MIRSHPNLALAGSGILLLLATPVLFSNLWMLHQFSWINLSPEVQFAGVMIQIILVVIGMYLLIMATLQSLRRWLHVPDDDT